MAGRLLRSCLFAPADRVKVLRKAWTPALGLDVMVIDMEDAVAAIDEVKSEARLNVMNFFNEEVATARQADKEHQHPELVVRVNDPFTTPWGSKDIEACLSLASPPSALVLPKAQNVADIKAVAKDLPKSTALWVMIEQARGIQNVDEIAAIEQVACLVFGSNDFSKDIGATLTNAREPLLYSMMRTIVAARAEGKGVIDGVFMNLEDSAQMEVDLRAQCIQGKEMGFDGKSLIHPKQIPITNEVWAPSPIEVDHAARVIECYTKAMEENRGVAVLDGKLIEALHVDRAKQLLMNHMLVEKKGERRKG